MVSCANIRNSAPGRRLCPFLWPRTEQLVHLWRLSERLQVELTFQDRCSDKVYQNSFTWHPGSYRRAWLSAYSENRREDCLLSLTRLHIHVWWPFFFPENFKWHVEVWFIGNEVGEDQAIRLDPGASLRTQFEYHGSENLPVWWLNWGHLRKQLVLQVRYRNKLLVGVRLANWHSRLSAINDKDLKKLRMWPWICPKLGLRVITKCDYW